MMVGSAPHEADVFWYVLYTKARAESWAEMNLRKQGYNVLLPRIRARAGFAPLFPRYIFVGCRAQQPITSLRGTLGVQYVVQAGDQPARVPPEVVEEIRSRMDHLGTVRVDDVHKSPSLFAARQRERIRAMIRLTQAGFRVRSA